jgi:hypothetical protein
MKQNEKRNERKYVVCPECGHSICKCAGGILEEVCEVCKTPLVFFIAKESMLSFKSRRAKERK